MKIKRFNGKPYGVTLTAAEQEAMRAEIKREFLKLIDKQAGDLDAMVLLILHDEFGFGLKRLKRFHAAYQAECERLKEFYQLREQDEIWYATKRLEELGLNIFKEQ